MNEEYSSSGFVSPADFSEEWRDITLVQQRSHNIIYTASRYGRRFLLKGLTPEEARLTDYRLQQEKEFQLGIQLIHPNIAATYGLEEVDGLGRCIVQEWIDGMTLGKWLQTKPSYSARKRVFEQLLDALEYIHGLQLVHHDLKTDNILITRNGANVKLIDFGLSATDATLSPVPNDPQKDIQALGRLLPLLLPRQRLLARRCRNRYTHIASLRRAEKRRGVFFRLVPLLFSALLFIAAAYFFHLSWNERHMEQQRYQKMLTIIDTYLAAEREQLTQIINSRDTFYLDNPADVNAYMACAESYSACIQHYWILRDSLADTYGENDPLREQFWQMWLHREAELNKELYQQLTQKLRK